MYKRIILPLLLLLSSSLAFTQDNRYCSVYNTWTGNTSDGPAAMPQSCINTALANTPSKGAFTEVAPGQSLATAYANASCGDTLSLAHGATWNAPFTFPPKNCDGQHWITIESDGTLPPEGARVTAQDQSQLAIFSFAANQPPATFGDHIRFIGIAWVKKPGAGQLLAFGLGKDARYIIFDRNRFLGNPNEETRRGFSLNNGQYIAIIESDFEEFHCIAVTGSCIDSQAISGGTGPGTINSGPFKIVNNLLEASTENILFGGDAADGCGPNDVEIRRNHFFKPPSWNPNDPGYIGVKYIVKNLFELKNGCRLLVEGNVMENNWGGFSQLGIALAIGPKNQSINGAGVCPLCTVTDVTIRYNHISNVAGFIAIASGASAGGFWSQGQHRTSVHDILIDGIQYPTCYGCASFLGDLSSGYSSTNPPPPSSVMSDVLVNHITQVGSLTLATGTIPLGWMELNGPPANNPTSTPTIQNVSWLNSISLAGNNGTFSSGGGANNCAVQPPGIKGVPLTQLASCFFGTSQFAGNIFVAYPKPQSDWPAGNFFSPDWSTLGFSIYAPTGGDYHLTFLSPYHAKGLDGRDPGADIDMINLFTAGVL